MTEMTKTSSSKSGIGVGSASIVLIFSVLCLTVFTLITYIVASNNKTLTDTETELVTGYYRADALAEVILAEIVSGRAQDTAQHRPGRLYGIDILTRYDEALGAETLYFYCPVSGAKLLYVNVVVNDGSYYILSWHMVDTDEWQPDTGINIWDGM